jgi:hypothetical protein
VVPRAIFHNKMHGSAVLMRRLALILIVCVACCSCDKPLSRKATFPVTGIVFVDGKPVDQLAIGCVNLAGIDAKEPTESATFTDKDGTYQKGDGVPVGSYVLTFNWGQWNLMSMQYGGPDKLNGKYSDPKTSTIKFDVKEGQPTDLGTIQLTTK